MPNEETLANSKKLTEELAAHGLILPQNVPGIFGRGAEFERVVAGFTALVDRAAKDEDAEKLLFPPCIDRGIFEKSEYLESFPQLAGTIFSFFGNAAQHRDLMAKVKAGEPWADTQQMTNVVLTPAACYPVYPTFAKSKLPPGGRLVDVQNWIFRHEPSPEPTRLQSFRMRELVRTGTPDDMVAWRDRWIDRGQELLTRLGLAARPAVANDPFFGRGGRMLAANQREQKLKFEIVVPVLSESEPTAVCSFNWHQDHFGKIFGITTSDGEVANTACLGFGLERITIALFKTHGMKTSEWPANVRAELQLA